MASAHAAALDPWIWNRRQSTGHWPWPGRRLHAQSQMTLLVYDGHYPSCLVCYGTVFRKSLPDARACSLRFVMYMRPQHSRTVCYFVLQN